MLVTNHGQIIRIRVHGGEGDSIRIAGRKTQGVRLFDVSGDADERVVSAGLIRDADDDDDEGDAAGDEDNTAENADENPADSGAENPDVASDDSPSGDEA